jgi:predicted peptidase
MVLRVAVTALIVAIAQMSSAPFAPRMFKASGHLMPYRLFVPKASSQEQKLPLIVWLHGASGVGTDNNSQISAGGNEIGSRLWTRPDIQDKHPAFVVAPQAPRTSCGASLRRTS